MKLSDYTWPMMLDSMKPYQHQKEATYFKLANPRCYDLSDLGTGKTLSSLWAADFLLINQKIKRVLVVSPLSTLQSVWGGELYRHFRHRSFGIAHGPRPKRAAVIASDKTFVIINHDGVVMMEKELLAAKFDLIIIDELTAFKKHTTNRSRAMSRIARRAKGVWGLTGAPTPNSPVEAYGQSVVVNPSNPFIPRSYSQYRMMVEYQIQPHIWIPKDGAEAVVHKILQPAIRYERDKCIDIPPCVYENLIVEFSKEQKRVYAEMKEQLMYEYKQGLITAVNAGVKMSKLLQIAAGAVKNDQGDILHLDSSNRNEAIWEIFEENGKRKLIVAAAFRASVDHLVAFFTKKGAKAAAIFGGTPLSVRSKLIQDFQDGDLQILVIQPQSTSHGVTLTAANVIVWHSLVPSGEVYLQFNGRITRSGQTRKQLIYHCIGSQVEKRLLSILNSKTQLSSAVLDMFADL